MTLVLRHGKAGSRLFSLFRNRVGDIFCRCFHVFRNMRSLAVVIFACAIMAVPKAGHGAISIVFDYTYDSGFFSGANAGRRTILDEAAAVFENRLTLENFGAITPSGGNTWSLSFTDPSEALPTTIQNPVVPANTITIYPGARNFGGSGIAGSSYSYTYSGDAAWVSLFQGRDSATNFDSFGGSLSFDTATPWYFDSDVQTLESFPGEYDFYSVAQHEIAHLLGFDNQAHAFAAQISGSSFVGANVEALYGGPAPLASSTDTSHWSQNALLYGNGTDLMQPTFFFNQRKTASELDFAALKDIGYNVSNVPEPSGWAMLTGAAGMLWIFRRRPV
jgi:hypothetical protein